MFDAEPEGWKPVTLAEIASISMGETLLSKDMTGLGVPVFSANTDDAPWGYTDKNRKTLRRGAIVVGARGSIGFPRLPPFDAFTCTQTTISVEPDSSQVDSTFLVNALRATDIKGLSAQQAVPMLTIGMLAPLVVSLPPLDEQRRIAKVLQAMDEAILASAAVLSSLERTVATLAAKVGEPTDDELTVADLGPIVTGRTPPPTRQELWGGDLPFMTPGDLRDDAISARASERTLAAAAAHGAKVLPPRSVLVTCIGSTIGKTAIVRGPCATNQQINAVCCDPEIAGYVYLACVALYDDIAANAGRQAVPIINKSTFSQLPVARRSREEMVAISVQVDALDEQMEASRRALRMLSKIRTEVASDLLSGRVRVPA